jgi:hypothetical protein
MNNFNFPNNIDKEAEINLTSGLTTRAFILAIGFIFTELLVDLEESKEEPETVPKKRIMEITKFQKIWFEEPEDWDKFSGGRHPHEANVDVMYCAKRKTQISIDGQFETTEILQDSTLAIQGDLAYINFYVELKDNNP